MNSPYCFIAGTVVLTVTGKRVIESIEAGDLVWSWDEATGDVALKEVIETYENETTELVHVFVNGDEIISTPAHPFYLPDEGWITAEYLDPGDTVVLANGEYDTIDEVYHETLSEPVTVYNFNVEDYHTYYVGEDSVLVHNACKSPENLSPKGAGRRGAFRQAKRDMGIPVSRQPDAVLPNYSKQGKLMPGRVYKFGDEYIRDDVIGHSFSDGGAFGRHFNTPYDGHYFY